MCLLSPCGMIDREPAGMVAVQSTETSCCGKYGKMTALDLTV